MSGARRADERASRLLPGGAPRWIRLYDNGGETTDRYTLILTNAGRAQRTLVGWTVGRGMSASPYSPQGFGLSFEYRERIDVDAHGFPPAMGRKGRLGRRIAFAELPEPCQRSVMSDYCELWGLEVPA